MIQVSVTTDIAAPPEEVWASLASLSTFDSWNPLIRHVDLRRSYPGSRETSAEPNLSTGVRLGTTQLHPGDEITIHVALSSGMTPIDVTISRAGVEHTMGWRFVERSPLLYRGEHVFRLRAHGDGSTRLVDQESFWGVLVPLRRRGLHERITASMTLMGQALKQHVEGAQQ